MRLTPVIPLLALLALPAPVRGQGCVATGQSGLMLGDHGMRLASWDGGQSSPAAARASGPYLRKGGVELSLGYRFFRSHRHFVGATEQTHREAEGSEVVNSVNLLDLSATYGLTRRTSLTLGLPVLRATRWGSIRKGGVIVGRNVTESTGIGDLRVVANRWMFDPGRSPAGNAALSFGLKLPTGQADDRDVSHSATAAAEREVDQSIQPGDGGVGLILGLQSFRALGRRAGLYADGNYLANPRGTSGVATNRGRASEAVMSVADQYLARAGVSAGLWPSQGLAGSVGLRLEGLPPRDLLGPSDGFRRPGFTASVEPGLSLALGHAALSVAIPVAFHRERQRSVPDEADSRHGDAAFADYSLLFSVAGRW